MSYIYSIGLGIPIHSMPQDRVKKLVQSVFLKSERKVNRLLPVFDHAKIKERQLVVQDEWFKKDHTFQEKNDLYQKYAIKYSLEAVDHCLQNGQFLNDHVQYEDIDMIVFVSSTGIATPSLDVHLMNARPFREDVIRMPFWGLGCAGGAIGLARASDWVKAYPTKNALVVCCELCSLTFQKEDTKVSNIVGTALFGDGASAALIIGEQSKLRTYNKKSTPKIIEQSSLTKKNTVPIMGWDITNHGLEVVFSKSIPKLVKELWKNHVHTFLNHLNMTKADIHSLIAHPGGRKVLEAMEEGLEISKNKLIYSYQVLADHGNMSSVTVLYVLKKWLKEDVSIGNKSLLSALGPGFSSELLLLEWHD